MSEEEQGNLIDSKTLNSVSGGLLSEDMEFHSKHFQGSVKITGYSIEKNVLNVRINDKWDEDWNLQHTIWGFENGDYFQ